MKKIIFPLVILMCSLISSAQNVGVGNTAPASKLDVSGDISLREGAAITTITANTITLPTAKNSIYRITAASPNINTISGGNDGMLLTLIFAGTGAMTITNNTGNILTNTGSNMVSANAAATVTLIYNASLTKWVVASAQGFIIPTVNGGMGANMTAGAIGAIPYANSTTSYGTLADVVVGSFLTSGGLGAAPTWTAASSTSLGFGSWTKALSATTPALKTDNQYVTGNVGIGDFSASTPATKLQVAGGGSQDLIVGNSGNSQQIMIGTGVGYSGIQSILQGTGFNAMVLNGGGGNVGIGLTSPTVKLQVMAGVAAGLNEALRLSGGSSASGSGPSMSFQQAYGSATDGTYPTWKVGEIGGLYNSGASYGGDLVFTTNTGASAISTTEKMRILYNGNVGIGNTAPSTLLHIGSTNNSASSYMTFSSGNGSQFRSWQIGVPYGNTTTSSPNYGFTITDMGNATTPPFMIDFNTHNIGMGTTTPSGNLHIYTTTAGSITGANGPLIVQNNATSAARGIWMSNTGGGGSIDIVGETFNGHTGAAPATIRFVDNNYATDIAFRVKTGTGSGNANNGDVEVMRISSTNGWVGIGTSSPLAGLDVELNSGATSITSSANRAYIQPASTGVSHDNGTGSGQMAIYANGYIASNSGVMAISDIRMKNVIGQSNSAEDLRTLNKIQITNYTMKDKLITDGQKIKKVIAQQVAEVYPAAVKKGSLPMYIPNIYQEVQSYCLNGSELSIAMPKTIAVNSDIKAGAKCKFFVYTRSGYQQELKGTILGIYENTMHVKTDTTMAQSTLEDRLFVYGTEIHDLLTVDYDAISMLNVSATQELAKKLAGAEEMIQLLRSENIRLQTYTQEQADMMKSMKAEVDTIRERLNMTSAK